MATLSFLTYLRGIYHLNLNQSSKVHYAIIQSLYDVFIMAKGDLNKMRLEMCLSTATGYWLDYWGDYFAIYRKNQEADAHYSKRIIDSVIQPKSTIPAIKDNVVDHLNSEKGTNYTREDVIIKEPWRELAKYSDKGSLSGTMRFHSPDYYSHAVIDISIPEGVTPDLVDLVKSVKAAGVKVLWTILVSYDVITGFHDGADAYASYSRHLQTQATFRKKSCFILSQKTAVLSGNKASTLSGKLETCSSNLMNAYTWYADLSRKDTDSSLILTKKDLLGVLTWYNEQGDYVITQLTNQQDNTQAIKDSWQYLEDLSDIVHMVGLYAAKGLPAPDTVMKKSGFILSYHTAKLSQTSAAMSDSKKIPASSTSGYPDDTDFEDEHWNKLLQGILEFKKKNPRYYTDVQPPILNGERANWLVRRHYHYLWDTPSISHKDLWKLWIPLVGESSYSTLEDFENAYNAGDLILEDKYQPVLMNGEKADWLVSRHYHYMWDYDTVSHEELWKRWIPQEGEQSYNSLKDFESAHDSGQLVIEDKYQPPVVSIRSWLLNSELPYHDWMLNSPAFLISDLEEIYQRQLGTTATITIGDGIHLDSITREGYPMAGNLQPEIVVTTTNV